MSGPQDEAHRAGTSFLDMPSDSIGFYFEGAQFLADSVPFAVAHVGTSQGQEIWLARGDRYRPGFDSTTWTVLASMIPVKDVTNQLRLWLSPCTRNGVLDHQLVVMLLYEDLPVLDKIVRAWHVDPAGRRFVPIDTTGIKCPKNDPGE